MTAKDKDRVLREIKEHKKPSDIKDLSKCLYDLEKDGFVKTVYTTDRQIVCINFLPQGERFLDSGGYSAIVRQRRKEDLRLIIAFVAGAVTTKAIDIIAQILLPK